jgi:hypothetical protein
LRNAQTNGAAAKAKRRANPTNFHALFGTPSNMTDADIAKTK